MKTEEAPEKIYIGNNGDQYYFYLTNPNGDSVEYTRTDAFIEKAKEFLWTHIEGSDYHVNYVLKEFENYMKG